MCITTTHWATHISNECATGGSAVCDGTCSTHFGVECSCSCHSEHTTLPETVEEVLALHDEWNDVVGRFHGYVAARAFANQQMADRTTEQIREGMVYRICAISSLDAMRFEDEVYVQRHFNW